MNANTFSTPDRRFYPWEAYKILKVELAGGSLVGEGEISSHAIRERVDRLTDLESTLGVVYVGEKRWLESRLLASSNQPYSDWVFERLRDIFPGGLRFQPYLWKDQPDLLNWSAYTEDVSFIHAFEETSNNSVLMDCILITMSGESNGADPTCLATVFEILHDLPYYLVAAAPRNYPLEKVSLGEIFVPKDSEVWMMELISDYGASVPVHFKGDEVYYD